MAAILHLLILSVLCVYSPSNIESVPSSVGIMRDSSSFQHPILTVPETFTKLFLYTHEIRFLNKIKIPMIINCSLFFDLLLFLFTWLKAPRYSRINFSWRPAKKVVFPDISILRLLYLHTIISIRFTTTAPFEILRPRRPFLWNFDYNKQRPENSTYWWSS